MTVAVYVPAERPVTGVTVKIVLPPTAISVIDVVESVKAPGLVPDNVTDNAPVDWLPVLFIVAPSAACGA